MKRFPFILGLAFLVLAAVVLTFAEGLRRFYSGGFFLVIAVFLLLSSRRTAKESRDSNPED